METKTTSRSNLNDKWGGAEIDQPEWKIPVWKLFKNNWNNPNYGGGDSKFIAIKKWRVRFSVTMRNVRLA